MQNIFSRSLISLFLSLSLVLIPQIGFAQTSGQTTECDRLRTLIGNNGGGSAAQLPSYCDPVSVYSKIVGIMYYIIGIVAVISLIYAGYLYMTARDNEAQLKKAKSTILWTIVGIVVAVLATLIVSAVINLIVDNKVF